MAMPIETASAADSVRPWLSPAKTTPTAIPSGRLCMVTASASIAVRDRRDRGPSARAAPLCKWGITSSISNRKAMPARKPIDAGNIPPVDISIEGSSSDHTLAATITPDAKPSSVFCSRSGMSFFMKKTNDDPSMVPANGSKIPISVGDMVCFVWCRYNGRCCCRYGDSDCSRNCTRYPLLAGVQSNVPRRRRWLQVSV